MQHAAVCNYCHKTAPKMKWCSNCNFIKYCSKECQVAHWPVHKIICKSSYSDAAKVLRENLKIFWSSQKVSIFCAGFAHYLVNVKKFNHVNCTLGLDNTGTYIAELSGTNNKDKDTQVQKLNIVVRFCGVKVVYSFDFDFGKRCYDAQKMFMTDTSATLTVTPMTSGDPFILVNSGNSIINL